MPKPISSLRVNAMQQQQLPSLILIEAALGVTWCNGSLIGTTKVADRFTKLLRTYTAITPNDVHTCK
jgi:hypothetical protein